MVVVVGIVLGIVVVYQNTHIKYYFLTILNIVVKLLATLKQFRFTIKRRYTIKNNNLKRRYSDYYYTEQV